MSPVDKSVAALRGSPGPVLMTANKAADQLEMLHRACTLAEQALVNQQPRQAVAFLRNALEAVGK